MNLTEKIFGGYVCYNLLKVGIVALIINTPISVQIPITMFQINNSVSIDYIEINNTDSRKSHGEPESLGLYLGKGRYSLNSVTGCVAKQDRGISFAFDGKRFVDLYDSNSNSCE
jgi:hypothetical protein